MSIFDYINKYGDYSFDLVEFNEVDNVILALLSYLDLGEIVSSSFKDKKSISEVGSIYFENYNPKVKRIKALKDAIEVFRAICDKKRYRDILMYLYVYVGDSEQQFSCLCLDISDEVVYISFEGTDHLISGWEEDFRMFYEFPVLSQRRAIKYINRHFTFSSKKLILGGHSKGGNLALVAAMYSNYFVKKRIIKVYNNDGPGLRKREINSSKYKSISNRLIHLVPSYSFFGLLLRHGDNYIVVKSKKKSIQSHMPNTWVIDDVSFKRDELSVFSKVLDEGMTEWMNKYDHNMRRRFVVALFNIFRRCNINTVLEIMEKKVLIFKILKEGVNIDDEVKDMIGDFIGFIFSYFKDYHIEKIKEMF